MDYGPLIKARKALEGIWKSASLRGRCWGKRKDGNPFGGSNITIAIDGELVSLSQEKDGTIRIHQFLKVEKNSLGDEIKEILKREGLSFKD